jgi:hypothetical protein
MKTLLADRIRPFMHLTRKSKERFDISRQRPLSAAKKSKSPTVV